MFSLVTSLAIEAPVTPCTSLSVSAFIPSPGMGWPAPHMCVGSQPSNPLTGPAVLPSPHPRLHWICLTSVQTCSHLRNKHTQETPSNPTFSSTMSRLLLSFPSRQNSLKWFSYSHSPVFPPPFSLLNSFYLGFHGPAHRPGPSHTSHHCRSCPYPDHSGPSATQPRATPSPPHPGPRGGVWQSWSAHSSLTYFPLRIVSLASWTPLFCLLCWL